MFRSALIAGLLAWSAAAQAQSYPTPTFNTVKVLNGADLRPTVNALLYGADPTGTNDSTAAINAAIQASQYFGFASPANPYRPGACVYIPAGNYKITDAIIPDQYNSCIYGDGRVLTYLMVDSSTFNLSALGVINLQNSGGGTTAEVRDLNILLNQPDTSNRVSLPAVPPAIYANSAGRIIVQRVQIGGGFGTCVDARATTGGGFFDKIECGSISYGLREDGATDGVHVTDWHQWPFGMIGKPGLLSIYEDGTSDCFELGRVDWLGIENAECFYGNVVWTANAVNSVDGNAITNLVLDGSKVVQTASGSPGNFIANLQCGAGAATPWASTYQCIVVSGGSLRITNFRAVTPAASTLPAIQVSSPGSLTLVSGTLTAGNAAVQAAKVTSGLLAIYNTAVFGQTGQTVPVVEEVGGSMIFSNDRFGSGPSGGTGVGVAFDTDSGQNLFSSSVMLGWSVTLPATHTAGTYGFSGAKTAGACVMTFSTGIITNVTGC